MPDEPTPPAAPEPQRMGTQRLEAFSDGVFAIAITLLVLDITVPTNSQDHLLSAFVEEWPAYLAYLVSFSTIGAVWLGHSAITEYLDRSDALLVRLNLLLLMVVSFLPFPTRMLAQYIREARAERVAATVYGINLLAAAGMLSVVWWYGVRAKLVRPDAADEEVETITRRVRPSLAGYVALIVVGLFVPPIAVIGYLVIAMFLIVPFGLFRMRHRGG